jgi:hypothetical protein
MAELRALEALETTLTPAIGVGARATPPRLERWADRLVDALPGDFPGRPGPVWAGIAGLILAITLWGLGLALRPPRATR